VVAVLLVCAACTETVEVLSTVPEEAPVVRWERCPEPIEKAQVGEACVDTMGECSGLTAEGCCKRRVHCVSGRVEVLEDCAPNCGGQCVVDSQCPMFQQWCEAGVCRPCPLPTEPCPPCPVGLVHRLRNGCRSCECQPPSACRSDAECGPGQRCYAGSACGEGCRPGDVSCCGGNLCGEAGCLKPSPVGCRVTGCGPGLRCEIVGCAPSSCLCMPDGAWVCTNDCVGGTCVPL
jgi:hypothetical protein